MIKPFKSFFKKKEETDFEVVKSRSGLPMFIIPIPSEINMDTEEKPNQQILKEQND